MQFISGANRLERIRRRRVKSGELIDVTHEALRHGIAHTVCISKRLWSSLIQPFPFAEPGDCLSLSALLGILKRHLSASHFASATPCGSCPFTFRSGVAPAAHSRSLLILPPAGRDR